MKKLSLQWRITLLTAVILAACSAALTALSMYNAQQNFMVLMDDLYIMVASDAAPPPSPDETVPGVDSTPAERAKRQFDTKSILFCLIFTATGSCAVYFMAGQALKPLRELNAEIETIDEKRLSARLPQVVSRDEVGKLTDNFNQMLSRLDDAFLRQKRFTANAAHELKTPLATLKAGAQVLSRDKNASMSDYQEYAQKNVQTVDRLSNIVTDLLLLASAGENWGQEKEPVHLEPLFEAIQNELFPQLEERNMTLIIKSGDISVMGSDFLLYRAFYNLIENACKYGHNGGHIWVETYEKAEGVSVCVKDDGPGIPQQHLPYIFDAFYRVDKSRSREKGGSGLGLSLVKTMVEAQGRSIAVESDGENGTCFAVTLPAE